MFNRISLFSLFLFLFFAACEKTDQVDNELTDEAFIEALVTDPNLTEVSFAALPPTAAEEVETTYFETFVETVEHAAGRGFILRLANGETLYCRENGGFVNFDAEFRPGGPFAEHPNGRCFRRLRRFARMLPPAELSATITDYVATNYPEDSIRGAKAWGDSTLVGITGGTVLLFGAGDEFLQEWDVLDHCTDRCGIVRPAVRQTINAYVTANYPDAEVRRSCRRVNRIFVLLRQEEGRVVLIFDTDGNFLSQRP